MTEPIKIGRYRLLGKLGGGGMGIVYLGEEVDGTPVAIKVVRSELADDLEFRIRFRHEVEAASRVGGAFTAKVLDADAEAEEPYFVTEYIPGLTLGRYVAQKGPLDEVALVGFAVGLAEALHAIHTAGLVHRDLKPSNVILTDGGPRVIDFGIARAVDGTAITRTGVKVGTPAWMAPEQARGEKSGPPADVFSWGLLVGFAASGTPPFGEGPSDSVMYRIVHEEPVLSGIPPQLGPLVTGALAKDPSARLEARALVSDLVDGEQDGVSITEAATSFISDTWALEPETEAVAPLGTKRGSWLRRMALAAVLVGLGVGGTISARAVLTEDGESDIAARPVATTTPSPTPTSEPDPSPARDQVEDEEVVADRPTEAFTLFNRAIGATTPWYNDLNGPHLDASSIEGQGTLLGAWWGLADWCSEAGHGGVERCYDLGAGYINEYFDRDPRTINSETWGSAGAIGEVLFFGYEVTAGYLGIESPQYVPDLVDGRPGIDWLCEPSCSAARGS